MTSLKNGEIEVSFDSDLCYLDLVQEISDRIARLAGFDSDSLYWIGLSLRESVTNAIQHGNKLDRAKRVELRFEVDTDKIVIIVRDHGEGVSSDFKVPDPLNPENLLKPSGRGIFFVRSFMDNVSFVAHPEGGLQVRMEKRLNPKK